MEIMGRFSLYAPQMGFEHAEPADSESNSADTDHVSLCIAVGGMASIELIAVAAAETGLGNEVVKEGKEPRRCQSGPGWKSGGPGYTTLSPLSLRGKAGC